MWAIADISRNILIDNLFFQLAELVRLQTYLVVFLGIFLLPTYFFS